MNCPNEELEYKRIRSIKAFQIPCVWLTRSLWLEQRQTMLLADPHANIIYEIDLNGNLLASHSPDPTHLGAPSTLCLNSKNELFIYDNCRYLIQVYTLDFEYLRRFGDERLIMCLDKEIDIETDLLYIVQYFKNLISIWNSATGKYVNEILIHSPISVRVKHDCVFVLSAIETEIFTEVEEPRDLINNSNTISVIDKKTLNTLRKISVQFCLNPKGFLVDDSLNFYLAAHDPGQKRENAKYLFKLNSEGELIHKINLRVSFVFYMSFIRKMILLLRAYLAPPLVLVEFD